MDNEKYKLVGIYNDGNLIPNSVYPVFVCKGNDDDIYIGFTNDDLNECNMYYFTNFQKLSDNNKKNVRLLCNCTAKIDISKEYYEVGDLAIHGMELEKNVIYIGTIDKYLDFLRWYKYDFNAVGEIDTRTEYIQNLDKEIDYYNKLVDDAREDGLLSKKIK